MAYSDIVKAARDRIGPYCRACPECNGRACRNTVPGPGAKGVGDTAIRNYDCWKEIRINMDTIADNHPIDTSVEIFGRRFTYPFFAGPVGAVNLHYGDLYDDIEYNDILVRACAEAGIAAFTGDGTNPDVMIGATAAIEKAMGQGVPTVKPWDVDTVAEKMAMVRKSGAFAAAMDVDAAGLPFLKGLQPPAGRKSVAELKQIAEDAGVPFIVKGIMTPSAAVKAVQAGAAGIIISNHGGRVLDQCPATAEVMPEIVNAVKGKTKIFVDGGIRSGADVFKALAMGANGVLLARPFVTAVYGGADQGVKQLIEKIGGELEDVMQMTGANSIADITEDMIF